MMGETKDPMLLHVVYFKSAPVIYIAVVVVSLGSLKTQRERATVDRIAASRHHS